MAVTDKDIEKLKKVFATKEELFKTKEELKSEINDSRSEMHQKFDQILTGQDKIMKELQSKREEQIIIGGQIRDHERRMAVLEVKLAA